ncbi:MAG TPA: hypothetical protein QGF01_02295, partial [Candidatus Nitrosopelagicus sp.]|nr:hypothetical protein [Candidatus Nitrosopelagicus sp.]
MRQIHSILFVFLVIFLIGTIPNVLSAVDIDLVTFYSVKEITQTSLILAEINIQNGNNETGKQFIDFASQQFSNNLQELRQLDSNLTDEIHISLIDLQTQQINSDNQSQISSQLEKINELLSTIPEDVEYNPNVIVALLIIADQQYENFETNDDEFSYQISLGLIERANQIFYAGTDYDERQKIELESFFNDLFEQVKNKDSFSSVGTLISFIQRDLLGTDVLTTAGIDNSSLYNIIRELYGELLIELDNGNYDKAEEI